MDAAFSAGEFAVIQARLVIETFAINYQASVFFELQGLAVAAVRLAQVAGLPRFGVIIEQYAILEGAVKHNFPAGEDGLDEATEAEAFILEVHVALFKI